MINQKKKAPLNTKDVRVQELSRKYNLNPRIIAYLRAAIGSGTYTSKSLIEHIGIENNMRWIAIEGYRIHSEFPLEVREKLIEYTMVNINFREDVVVYLNKVSPQEMDDILK